MTTPEVIERDFTPTNPLHPVSIGDLMAMDLPERRTLLPWLPEGGLVMVYGPRGVGKTYFTASLAVSLTCGEPFMKWKPSEAVGALLVDGEMAVAELRERLTNLLPHKPVASLEIVSHEIVFDKTEKDLNLGAPEWQQAVHQYLEDWTTSSRRAWRKTRMSGGSRLGMSDVR